MLLLAKRLKYLLSSKLALFLKILPAVFLLFMSFPFAAAAQERNIYQRLDTPYYDLSDTSSGCATAALNGTLPSGVPEPHNSLFTQAAAAFRMNPQFLAAIFLTENGNVWKPFDTKWATSPAGASGPFQFMPATWATYQTDGNGDGVKDINNMYDAAYSAAKLLATYASLNAPLGLLNTPYKPNTLLEAAAAYNWGPGNVQMHTTPSSSITGDGSVPKETQEYVSNVYSLITSDFTKSGKPGYPDPSPGSNSVKAAIPVNGSTGGCPSGSGVVAGNITQTAINFSWPEDRGSVPKPEYAAAVQKYNPGSSCSGADCGVFVATVMIASGADTNYPKSGTSAQEAYVRSSGKYDVVDKVNDTSELQPGDILIVNAGSGAGAAGHTYIYVGQQPGGKNAAAASWSSDCSNASMPRLTMAALSDSRGNYLRARIK